MHTGVRGALFVLDVLTGGNPAFQLAMHFSKVPFLCDCGPKELYIASNMGVGGLLAYTHLLAVAPVWIILLPTVAAAKAPVVEAPTGAARVVSNVTVLSKPTVGNAAAQTAATVASRPR